MPARSGTNPLASLSLPAEQAAQARADFTAFKRLIWKRYEHAPHLVALDAALMQCARHVETGGREGIGHLIVEMPPRHGKSFSVSRLFPAWFLGRNPDCRVILASYGATLAEKNSRYARKVVQMPVYRAIFPGLELAADSRAADAWDLARHEGGLDAVGVGGGVTGKGGHCLPGNTLVATEQGYISIDHLCRLYFKPKVLAFNHESGCLTFRQIVATKESTANELVEIITTRGRCFRATSEHLIYVVGRGYVPAGCLRIGDSLIVEGLSGVRWSQRQVQQNMLDLSLREPQRSGPASAKNLYSRQFGSKDIRISQSLPNLRRSQRQTQQTVLDMSRKKSGRNSHASVRILWQNFRERKVSAREGQQAGMSGYLLLQNVQSGSPRYKTCAPLCALWCTNAGKAKPQILFPGMQAGVEAKEKNILPLVRSGNCTKGFTNPVLFKRMRKCSAFCQDEGNGQFTFQNWHELCEMVCRNASSHHGKRWQLLHCLPANRSDFRSVLEGANNYSYQSGNSPYQRGPYRQFGRKSNYTLSEVSFAPSSLEEDTVAMVRNIRTGGVQVYDLQVEGCSNFFAEGVLVHNCIIIDDPVKSREEAESPIIRDKVWDWFTDDLYTRREPGAAMVIAMTRWHTNDLVGRLLHEQPDKWHVIRLPALAEENDPLGRAIGAPLWPQRFGLDVLRDIQSVLGEYAWLALYQQRPIPSEGGVFKRAHFRIINVLPECAQVVRFWDLAMSERTSADYTAGVKLGITPDQRIVVLDVVRRRVEWDQLAALMADTALRDGPDVRIGFERQGFMSRAGQALAQDPRLHHYAIWGYAKDQDKLTNALPLAGRVGLGIVDVIEAPWTRDYLDELCSFPRGAHDDQVDASAGAYEMLGGEPTAGGMNYADDYTIGGAY